MCFHGAAVKAPRLDSRTVQLAENTDVFGLRQRLKNAAFVQQLWAFEAADCNQIDESMPP
jgi:hypothetical protein